MPPPQPMQLASLRPVGTALIPAVPTLYTTLISTADPMTTCAGIINNADKISKDAFLENYMASQTQTIQTTQAHNIMHNLQTFYSQLTDSTVDQRQTVDENAYTPVDSYLTNLSSSIPLIQLATNCLTESAGTPLVTLTTDYNNQKELLDESKERLEFIKAPEEHVSYYAGWFPLFRPMKPTVLFWLFGISLALLIVSILLFLRVGGVEIHITLPAMNMGLSGLSGMSGISTSYMNYLMVGSGGLVVGGIIAYFGYKGGWFGS